MQILKRIFRNRQPTEFDMTPFLEIYGTLGLYPEKVERMGINTVGRVWIHKAGDPWFNRRSIGPRK